MSARYWKSVQCSGTTSGMLKTLRVQGLSLLSDVRIELGPGLNVFTGETGAGKSLLVSALGLLLGRGSGPRTGDAEIEAEFSTRGGAGAREGNSARLVLSGTRARASMDGRAVALTDLRSRMAELIALTAQSSVRELASPKSVLSLLDQRAGLATELSQYRTLRSEYLALGAELRGLQAELAVRSAQGERTSALLEDLIAAEPRPGEHASLEQRIDLVSKRQQYLELCARVEQALSLRDESIERELGQLLSATRRSAVQRALTELSDELAHALDAVGSASRIAAHLASDLDNESHALEPLERRREQLERLAARVGCSVDALPDAAQRLESEREQVIASEERVSGLGQALERMKAELEQACDKLHAAREKAVSRLGRDLEGELCGLSLENAVLKLSLSRRAEVFGPDGQSALELAFSANPGHKPEPLERVASGGERSRFVLALACVGAAEGRCLVFDEVDQGVGGIALERMADRLAELARSQQVVCVTHQAAIAARADVHFRVEKASAAGVTRTSVLRLDESERLQEIARMLAGGRAPDGAKALARRLLSSSRPAA